jgi:hypothetical protein
MSIFETRAALTPSEVFVPSDSQFNPFLYAPAEFGLVSIILERSGVGVHNVCSADAKRLEMGLLWSELGRTWAAR